MKEKTKLTHSAPIAKQHHVRASWSFQQSSRHAESVACDLEVTRIRRLQTSRSLPCNLMQPTYPERKS